MRHLTATELSLCCPPDNEPRVFSGEPSPVPGRHDPSATLVSPVPLPASVQASHSALSASGALLIRDLQHGVAVEFSRPHIAGPPVRDYGARNCVRAYSLGTAAERGPGPGANRNRLAPAWRPWMQAADTLDEADEAEDFQAVGMRCCESMVQVVRALADEKMLPAGAEPPKKADFIGWDEFLADHFADGSSAERVRGYLTALAREAWHLVNWLTRASNAGQPDAALALSATEAVLFAFGTASMRNEMGRPQSGRGRAGAGPVGCFRTTLSSALLLPVRLGRTIASPSCDLAQGIGTTLPRSALHVLVLRVRHSARSEVSDDGRLGRAKLKRVLDAGSQSEQ